MIIYVTLNTHFTTFEVSNVEAGYVVSKNLLEYKAKPTHQVKLVQIPNTFGMPKSNNTK